jgi:hypothetical protein
MAEVGLVRFARTALTVLNDVFPAYSHKFSKHTFTQPQMKLEEYLRLVVELEQFLQAIAGTG